ncbi:MAG: LacI family DNA-binding transcriptional regulator, partial [Leadbetterella sp.]
MKKTTITDIADFLGLTTSTVSRALNNNERISAETIKKVKKAAIKLNYKPNSFAMALRSGKSKTLGIIIPVLNRNFFSNVVKAIDDVANSEGYRIIITQTYESKENEIAAIDTLIHSNVDGILACITKKTDTFDHFNAVAQSDIPIVMFDRTSPEINTSQVIIDDYWAAYSATKLLIQKGCKKIVHFTSETQITIYKERLRGYMDALKEAKIEINEEYIIRSKMQLEDGITSMEKALLLKPDAVFSASDYSTMGALQTLKKHNVAIPKTIRLIGFGNEPFTEFTTPTLSTIDQKSIEMG